MRDGYLNDVIRRGNELSVLEQAALSFPEKASGIRWVLAAACCALVALFPSVCSACAFPVIV
jgi:hypothetical protein